MVLRNILRVCHIYIMRNDPKTRVVSLKNRAFSGFFCISFCKNFRGIIYYPKSRLKSTGTDVLPLTDYENYWGIGMERDGRGRQTTIGRKA